MSAAAAESTAAMKYVCGDCARVFCTKQQLLVHQYIHKEKPNMTCGICGRISANEAACKRHQRMHERGSAGATSGEGKKRKRLCAQCNTSFDSRTALEEHHRREHLADKQFGCNMCEAVFSWPANLARHQRSHESAPPKPVPKPDLPFVCGICKKGFKFDFSYEAHLNSHEVAEQMGGDTRELVVEILNVPGEPMASTVTIDPGQFTGVKEKPVEEVKKGMGKVVPAGQTLAGARAARSIADDDEDPPYGPDGKRKRRRRNPDPLIYDFTMTPEKRFVCEVCDMPFRWQISLYVHMREHFGMEPGLEASTAMRAVTRKRARARGRARAQGRARSTVMHSKIVVQRHESSDEEEVDEDEAYAAGDYRLRRRVKNRYTTIKAKGRGHPNEVWMKSEEEPVEEVVINIKQERGVRTRGMKSTRMAIPKKKKKKRAGGLFAVWAAPVAAAHMQWQRRRQTDRRAFPCGICSRVLPTRALREAHRLVHTPRHRCRRCRRSFPSASAAAIHHLSHTAPNTTLRCPLCAKQFAEPLHLESHVKTHAPRVTPQVCASCTRRFTTLTALEAHKADCTYNPTTSTYTCEVCHRIFKRKRYFELHRRSGCIFGAFDDDTL